jgi:hypothetical protein
MNELKSASTTILRRGIRAPRSKAAGLSNASDHSTALQPTSGRTSQPVYVSRVIYRCIIIPRLLPQWKFFFYFHSAFVYSASCILDLFSTLRPVLWRTSSQNWVWHLFLQFLQYISLTLEHVQFQKELQLKNLIRSPWECLCFSEIVYQIVRAVSLYHPRPI